MIVNCLGLLLRPLRWEGGRGPKSKGGNERDEKGVANNLTETIDFKKGGKENGSLFHVFFNFHYYCLVLFFFFIDNPALFFALAFF